MTLRQLKIRIKYVLGPVYHRFYNRPKTLCNVETEHYLSIAACVKDEGRYLREWIEYHLWAGVDHFYIYDNGSTDNTKEALSPYIARGIVTYHYWVEERKKYKKKQQLQIYLDAVSRYKHCTRWMALIDADEFMALSDEGKRQFGSEKGLASFFRQREQCPGIGINWVCFDGGGHEAMPKSGYVIDNYTRAYAGQNVYKTRGIKSVVQPLEVTFAGVHYCEYKGGKLKRGADENGRPLPVDWNFRTRTLRRQAELIRLHHYYSKSKEEYLTKISTRKWPDDTRRGYDEGDWAFSEWQADSTMKEAAECLRAKGVPETYGGC